MSGTDFLDLTIPRWIGEILANEIYSFETLDEYIEWLVRLAGLAFEEE